MTLYYGSHSYIESKIIETNLDKDEFGRVVFASHDRRIALCFAAKPWTSRLIHLELDLSTNDVIITEKVPGAIRVIFSTPGFLYLFEDENAKLELIGSGRARANDVEFVLNVLDELKKLDVTFNAYRPCRRCQDGI